MTHARQGRLSAVAGHRAPSTPPTDLAGRAQFLSAYPDVLSRTKPMNTTPLPTTGDMADHDRMKQLHAQVMAFTDEHGIELFIFSRDGRLLDTSTGLVQKPIEQVAALCSPLVNYSRGYSTMVDGAGVTRVVTRYETGSV